MHALPCAQLAWRVDGRGVAVKGCLLTRILDTGDNQYRDLSSTA